MKFALATLTTPLLLLCVGVPCVVVNSRGECPCALYGGLTAVILVSILCGICNGVVALLFRKSIRSWGTGRVAVTVLLAAAGIISVLLALPAQAADLLASNLGCGPGLVSFLVTVLIFLTVPAITMAIAGSFPTEPKDQRPASG